MIQEHQPTNVQPIVVNAVTGIISYSLECNRLVMLIDATRFVTVFLRLESAWL